MAIELRLLGRLEMRAEGRVVVDALTRPRKAVAILAILALQRNRTVSRDRLIDLLWPDAHEETGQSNLHKNLYQLRAMLEGADLPRGLVRVQRGVVTMDPLVAVDVDAFVAAIRRALASGATDDFEAALELYAGDLMMEDERSEWLAGARDELRQQALMARLELGRLRCIAGEWELASDQYQAALSSEPTAEEAHRGLMLALTGMGQRDRALRQFLRCEEILREELDVTPSEETVALAGEIRRGGPVAPPASARDRWAGRPGRDADIGWRARLAFRTGALAGDPVRIAGATVNLGRSRDNDLVLESARVSRFHARLVRAEAGFVLEDLNSRNGTWLNGERITMATLLRDGDDVRIGDVSAVYLLEDEQTMTMTSESATPHDSGAGA